MGKTYEALQRAEKELDEKLLEVSSKAPPAGVAPPPRRVSTRPAIELYELLKTNLLTRCADEPVKTILFAATAHGVGSSTTAINFATALAKDSQLKVLLIDVNLRTPSFHDVFKVDHTAGLSDILSDNSQLVESQIKKVGPGNLYVLSCGSNYSEPLLLFESKMFNRFLEAVRQRFDYVILDAPPASAFSESRVLCSKVDGVILVIESGKTRRQVALKAKEQVEEAGGRLLGVVLNKRKYYIPDWIYRRL